MTRDDVWRLVGRLVVSASARARTTVHSAAPGLLRLEKTMAPKSRAESVGCPPLPYVSCGALFLSPRSSTRYRTASMRATPHMKAAWRRGPMARTKGRGGRGAIVCGSQADVVNVPATRSSVTTLE